MDDPRLAEALGIPANPSDDDVARRFRSLLRLPPDSDDAARWVRFLEGVEVARTLRDDGPRGDRAELAHFTVGHAIVRPGEPAEDRYGIEAWDRELHVGVAEADDVLRELVIDEIAPRLARAGLYTLL